MMEVELSSETLVQYRTVHETVSYAGIVYLLYRLMCVSYTLHFFCGAKAPGGPRPLFYRGFTITLRDTTLGRTAVDE